MPRRFPLWPCAALSLALTVALAAGGCIRDNNKADSGEIPSNALHKTRVGNNDPRGVDDQPDWDRQARELKQRVDPRLPSELPTDPRVACEAMLAEVATFYISVEADPDQRAARMAQLQQTRERDLAACTRDTSVAAAVCVTLLLKDRDSEFPWLLDQCSRAYPKPSAEGQVGARERKAPALELTFVGDVIFGRYREDNRFDAIIEPDKVTAEQPLAGPFAELATQLHSDVLVGNLETPVVELRPSSSPIGSSIRFGGGRDDVQALADAGFLVMSLANNHYYDLRVDGQLRSPKVLADAGIFAIGASRTEAPIYRVESFEAKGWRIGFISVTNRINTPVPKHTPTTEKPAVPYIEAGDMPDELLPLVEQARATHDLMIVAVHWGDEYAEQPSTKQQTVARALIEGGVDMVIGHHPHVLQGIEHHQDGLIAYSLGNFLFENTGGIPRLTGVLRTKWMAGEAADAACLGDVVFHPAYVKRSPYPHPSVATGGVGKQVRKRVVDQAKALGTGFVEVQDSEDLRLDGLAACGA
jgi:hypothetical protein